LAVFDQLLHTLSGHFPGISLRWAFTSSGIRRKLEKQGRPVLSPHEALLQMQAGGIRHVAVVPLHLANGMEYTELAETVESFRKGTGTLTHLTFGVPLLADPDEWRRTLAVMLRSGLPERKPEEGVVLVAHGSLEPQAADTYRQAVALCRQVDPRLFLGMILGLPSMADVIDACRAARVSTVWLLPAMVAAGFSAREEIGGPAPGSWKSGLEAAGIQCLPVAKGLGQFEGVVSLWVDRCRRLLAE
jgi:sirohydrochlorin cobaltochelatase